MTKALVNATLYALLLLGHQHCKPPHLKAVVLPYTQNPFLLLIAFPGTLPLSSWSVFIGISNFSETHAPTYTHTHAQTGCLNVDLLCI